MKTFTHVHSSSRFDRSAESLEKAIEHYISVGSLVTFTEVASEHRERPVKDVPGWGHVLGDHSGRDDAGIAFDKSVWELVYKTTKIVDETMKVGAAFAVLRHKDTDNLLLVTALHLPASVEGRTGFERFSRRGRSWTTALLNWRREYNRLAKQYKVDAVLLAADWNLNIKRRIFLPLFKALLPNMKLVFTHKIIPVGGTHHKRWIDFSFIKGKLKIVRFPWLLKDDKSSDHRPYAETFRWI